MFPFLLKGNFCIYLWKNSVATMQNTCTSLNRNEVLTFGIKLFSGQVWLCSNSPSFYISSVEDVSILIRMLPDRIVWCSWQSLISLYINFSGQLIRNFNEFTVIPCKSMWSISKVEILFMALPFHFHLCLVHVIWADEVRSCLNLWPKPVSLWTCKKNIVWWFMCWLSR